MEFLYEKEQRIKTQQERRNFNAIWNVARRHNQYSEFINGQATSVRRTGKRKGSKSVGIL